MRIGVFGGGAQQWPSLNRTYQSYARALSAKHELVELQPGETAGVQADVVLNFSGMGGWDLLSCAGRPPIVFVLHGGAVLNAGFIRDRLPLFRSGDCFIGNCRSDQAVIEAMTIGPAPPTNVLPLPVAAELPSAAERESARKALGIDAGEGVVLIVSRLVAQKNVHNALRAVKEALLTGSTLPWRIVLVGSFWPDYAVLRPEGPPYHEWLRAEVARLDLESRLILLPAKLSAAQLRSVYCTADVALSLTHSIDENFGYFALEAMGAGVPVIGTAYGGQKDSIIAGQSGWPLSTWYTPGGIRSAYDQARMLLSGLDRAELQRMGKRAHQLVSANYGFDAFASRVVSILENAHSDRCAPAGEMIARPHPADPSPTLLTFEKDCLADYEFGIRHFVSVPPPSVADGQLLKAYAPLVREGDVYVGLDPAWPVRFAPRACEAEQLDLAIRDGCIIAREEAIQSLRALVTAGLLVPEQERC